MGGTRNEKDSDKFCKPELSRKKFKKDNSVKGNKLQYFSSGLPRAPVEVPRVSSQVPRAPIQVPSAPTQMPRVPTQVPSQGCPFRC